MLTAATFIDRANQIAKIPAALDQAQDFLNAILSDICQHYDFGLARGTFNFNFNPALTTQFGSGPYPLPLDYLRTSGSSGAKGAGMSVWYLYPNPAFPQGQPIFMTPIDLAEYDQYPQFPNQSTPELWATDMGGTLTQRIVLTTSATENATTTLRVASITNLVSGLAAAGAGITPGTTINGTPTAPSLTTFTGNTTAGSAVITGIGTTTGLHSGYTVNSSNVFAQGPTEFKSSTTIISVDSGTQITAGLPAFQTATGVTFTVTGGDVVLSAAATQSGTLASVFFGIAPVAYVYPPPLGTYPVTCRYQRQMPPITDLSQVPWFPDDEYIIDKLSAYVMRLSGDDRLPMFEQLAKAEIQKYADKADDKTNRSQQIQLDRRNYGGGTAYDRARKTKVQGW